jgi:hypothetical protein
MYRAIILPVVLYCCETSSFTLREDHRLKVFENRVLRGIFGLKGGSSDRRQENCMKNFIICKGKGVPLHAMEALVGRGGTSPTHT